MHNYEEIGAEIGRMVAAKQAAYGDSFGKSGDVLRIIYPNGIRPEQYDDALAVVQIVDKLFRIANDKGAFGENPFKDISGYGILGAAQDKTQPCRDTERRVPTSPIPNQIPDPVGDVAWKDAHGL